MAVLIMEAAPLRFADKNGWLGSPTNRLDVHLGHVAHIRVSCSGLSSPDRKAGCLTRIAASLPLKSYICVDGFLSEV